MTFGACVDLPPFSVIHAEWIDCEKYAVRYVETNQGELTPEPIRCSMVNPSTEDPEVVKACEYNLSPAPGCPSTSDTVVDVDSSDVSSDDTGPDVVEVETVAGADAVADSENDLVEPDSSDTADGETKLSDTADGDAAPNGDVTDCSSLSDQCRIGYADPDTGACVFAEKTGPCNDDSLCTENDECVAGECVGTPATTCEDGNPCTEDGCDPATGSCLFIATDGALCDDGDACTEGDVCVVATCTGTPKTWQFSSGSDGMDHAFLAASGSALGQFAAVGAANGHMWLQVREPSGVIAVDEVYGAGEVVDVVPDAEMGWFLAGPTSVFRVDLDGVSDWSEPLGFSPEAVLVDDQGVLVAGGDDVVHLARLNPGTGAQVWSKTPHDFGAATTVAGLVKRDTGYLIAAKAPNLGQAHALVTSSEGEYVSHQTSPFSAVFAVAHNAGTNTTVIAGQQSLAMPWIWAPASGATFSGQIETLWTETIRRLEPVGSSFVGVGTGVELSSGGVYWVIPGVDFTVTAEDLPAPTTETYLQLQGVAVQSGSTFVAGWTGYSGVNQKAYMARLNGSGMFCTSN